MYKILAKSATAAAIIAHTVGARAGTVDCSSTIPAADVTASVPLSQCTPIPGTTQGKVCTEPGFAFGFSEDTTDDYNIFTYPRVTVAKNSSNTNSGTCNTGLFDSEVTICAGDADAKRIVVNATDPDLHQYTIFGTDLQGGIVGKPVNATHQYYNVSDNISGPIAVDSDCTGDTGWNTATKAGVVAAFGTLFIAGCSIAGYHWRKTRKARDLHNFPDPDPGHQGPPPQGQSTSPSSGIEAGGFELEPLPNSQLAPAAPTTMQDPIDRPASITPDIAATLSHIAQQFVKQQAAKAPTPHSGIEGSTTEEVSQNAMDVTQTKSRGGAMHRVMEKPIFTPRAMEKPTEQRASQPYFPRQSTLVACR